ncbi:MAG TPA: glycine cleavage system aminomethyltransferase GcvT [Firmicutes bacterium]|nr:glycine cleavage system aminomethyltransferase GcvT [Candidatus Fermentithermobacillaceae bacterium]
MAEVLKKTPLYETHVKNGGRIVDFGGWALPVQFTGIKEEHNGCRTHAALWDVSNMGELLVEGKEALDLLQMILVNDVSKIYPGKLIYSPMCYPDGGIVDDLLVMCLAEDKYWLIVNGANIEKDVEWIQPIVRYFNGTVFKDISGNIAQLAIQGPNSVKIMEQLTQYPVNEIRYYHGIEDVDVAGVVCLVTRTGYTGEDGFELYCQADKGPELYEAVVEAGKGHGLVLAGLGCRDTLRFEASMSLYGHELDEDHTPLEAGLGRTVAFDKGTYFIGSKALMKQREKGLKVKLVGIEMVGKGVPRNGYKVFDEAGEKEIGYVTTGTFTPYLKKYLAMAYVPVEHSQRGAGLNIEIRGRKVPARVVRMPFYRREVKKR